MARSVPDFSESLKVLRKDAHIAPLLKKYGKPELEKYHSKERGVFAALLRSIIYQQLSGKAAGAIHARVLALFPDGIPTPAALLKLRTPTLRKAGLSVAKIGYVRDLAKKCIDGTVNEQLFPKMTSAEIVEHVTSVHGIGEWTAHMLLIFTLFRPDILPVGDLAIRKGFQRVYGLKNMPHKKEMEHLAQNWRDHASIASWYLWRVVDEQ